MLTNEQFEISQMMGRFQNVVDNMKYHPLTDRAAIYTKEENGYALCANYNYRVDGGITHIQHRDMPTVHRIAAPGKVVHDHIDGKFRIEMVQSFYFNPKDDGDYVANVIKNTLTTIIEERIPNNYCYLSRFDGMARLTRPRYLEGCANGPQVEITAHFDLFTIESEEFLKLAKSEEYKDSVVSKLCSPEKRR